MCSNSNGCNINISSIMCTYVSLEIRYSVCWYNNSKYICISDDNNGSIDNSSVQVIIFKFSYDSYVVSDYIFVLYL